MRKEIQILLTLLVFVTITSCNTGPKVIDYGNDGCHFCKMTIVDKIHGAQLVTDKGKVFKFDATECILNYLSQETEVQVGGIYTNFYESPTEFIAAADATFLISENLPSPMGANLTAFKTKESAAKVLSEKGGKLYNWDDLKVQLKY